jgi:hypothetical protein
VVVVAAVLFAVFSTILSAARFSYPDARMLLLTFAAHVTGVGSLSRYRISGNHGRYHNLKYRRSGHVLEGRYRVILVHDEPLPTGRIKVYSPKPRGGENMQNLEWLRLQQDGHYRENLSWLVDIDLILDSLAENRLEAIKRHKEFLAEEDDSDYEKPAIIGDSLSSLPEGLGLGRTKGDV